jgi:hypothetical protein
MDPVGNINQIVEALRQQIAEKTNRAKTGGKANTGVAGQKQHLARATNAEIQETIAKRLRAVDPDDPSRRHKTIRTFLEAVLLAELGEDLVNDPMFYELVSNVQTAMESDANTRQKLEQLAELLIQRA